MDIAGWLRSLGLEQYEPAFRENEIDADVLPGLTGEDLKDLGVTVVGHRRKLLMAAAAPLLLAPPPGPSALPDDHPARTGGRVPARGHGRAAARQAGGGARARYQ